MRSCVLGLLIVATAAMPSLGLGTPIQWSGNGHWYEAVYVPEGISWEAARVAAASAGGYLATINSEAENAFVFNLVSDPRFWFLGLPGAEYSFGPWLGGYQSDKLAEPAGHWRWVTEDPWSYTNWAPSSPNNVGGYEDWLHYFTNDHTGVLTPGPTWNDAPATNREWGYVIEWAYKPVPATTRQGTLLVAILLCAVGMAVIARRLRST